MVKGASPQETGYRALLEGYPVVDAVTLHAQARKSFHDGASEEEVCCCGGACVVVETRPACGLCALAVCVIENVVFVCMICCPPHRRSLLFCAEEISNAV